MKAIVQRRYGAPLEVLRLEDVDEPRAGDGEVLVRVRAAGVNALDWHLVTGEPTIMRLIGMGFRRPKHPGVGRDVAGVIEAVGPGATRFRLGDEVFGWCNGAFAELVVAREDSGPLHRRRGPHRSIQLDQHRSQRRRRPRRDCWRHRHRAFRRRADHLGAGCGGIVVSRTGRHPAPPPAPADAAPAPQSRSHGRRRKACPGRVLPLS